MKQINRTDFFTYIQSEQTSRDFLLHTYQKNGVDNFEVKSYENCRAFLYYLKHGLHFYETGRTLTTMIQPILFFYGMVHLIKASLLIHRPNYPESTKLLAHGVSTRKRKKKDYTFIEDEVTIHNNGLYSYFSEHLYQIDQPTFKRITMQDLFTFIPEMSPLLSLSKQSVMPTVGNLDTNSLVFSNQLLDNYHLTSRAFIERIKPFLPPIQQIDANQKDMKVKLTKPLSRSLSPFFFHLTNQTIHFPVNRRLFLPLSEVMVHYLLLYNLSMVSRYETEWWGDLLATCPDIDFPLIKNFLHITANKIPLLLENEMYQSFLTHVNY